jgi:hypothetical protein
LSSLADQVEKNPNDAVNQKRLLESLQKVSAGRFTQAAADYIKSAGLANSVEEWLNKGSTGTLPKDVMRQLIDGAHQNLKAAQDALAAVRPNGQAGGAKHQVGDIVTSKGVRYKITAIRPDGKYDVEEAK